MDYQQSREYIEDAKQYGSVLGLKNMQEMMRRLGNPQDKLSYVHVAGTNGKGSVIAYLYSVLSNAGYRIGRYISPAIYSYRERMETAGCPVSREKFAEYVTRVADVIENMEKAGLPHPTPFEIETAVAFLFFADENCDLVLLEVGMGGNLDATNIVSNVLTAVITPISMDHQEFLGNTLREIAEKKAGIIKPGCTVVLAGQEEEVRETIRQTAGSMGAEVFEAGPADVSVEHADIWGQRFFFEGEEYEISLSGEHQAGNAAVALKTLSCLGDKGFPTTMEQRKKGLKETKWPGRFSVIHKSPLFIVDGAHNPGAARVLAQSVCRYFSGKNVYYIIGMFKDKDYDTVLKLTCPYAKKIWTIETPDNPRALPARELARAAAKRHPYVEAAESIDDAVEKAFHEAKEEDVILAFGSLSFLGELTRTVIKREER